jgi:peptidoglycan/LPS O-acetylase OafA/YrhL
MNSAAHKPSSGFFFPYLDGLRGIAVLSVVLAHCLYFGSSWRWSAALNGLLNAGRLGVAIFFVMSGFLIGLMVFDTSKTFNWRSYALRRAGKILPPFLLSLLVALSLWVPLHGIAGVPFALFADVTTLANFVSVPVNKMNPLYWSLFVEIHFYACLPLIYLALRKVTKAADFWTCLLFFVVPIALRTILYCAEGPAYRHGYVGFQDVFPLRLDAFGPGLAFAAIYLRLRNSTVLARWAPKLPWAGVVLVCSAYLFSASTLYFQRFDQLHLEGIFLELAYVLAEMGTFLLLFLCFAPACFLGRVLGNRHFGFFGLVSYEWYLFHYPLRLFVRNFFPAAHGSVGIYLLSTAVPITVSLGLSALVYYWLSAPILDRIKQHTRASQFVARSDTAVVVDQASQPDAGVAPKGSGTGELQAGGCDPKDATG